MHGIVAKGKEVTSTGDFLSNVLLNYFHFGEQLPQPQIHRYETPLHVKSASSTQTPKDKFEEDEKYDGAYVYNTFLD